MNIGQAARAANLPTKTVRYYADIGLIRIEPRQENGYRTFSEADVRKLSFIRKARAFDFSIDECRQLLDLYENQTRSSADVKRITMEHLHHVEDKMRELQSLRDELMHLADACHGDERPDCPILDGLAAGNPALAQRSP